jgi:hypothetical protein
MERKYLKSIGDSTSSTNLGLTRSIVLGLGGTFGKLNAHRCESRWSALREPMLPPSSSSTFRDVMDMFGVIWWDQIVMNVVYVDEPDLQGCRRPRCCWRPLPTALFLHDSRTAIWEMHSPIPTCNWWCQIAMLHSAAAFVFHFVRGLSTAVAAHEDPFSHGVAAAERCSHEYYFY